ncbi:hypothetical protein [Pseudochelatococcus contaminans]|uniref:Uncharacterized protein n=1 Tax=Pseudochelatococcus contaminans TaxID=1538103 RepID=A0A7W5Z2D0_9HYPH|nr:hypothetical protein [Pseudochelatococcus contaminans]MBB3808723.1 hypothetical protein [Pseudochelatococcus contaminans]
MTYSRAATFRPIGQILTTEVLPQLYRAQNSSLRAFCIGTVSYDGGDDPASFDRIVLLGECPSPEEAMSFAALRLSRGDIHASSDDRLCFHPRVMVIQDREQALVLAGEVRARIILWQQPVASDCEARRIVNEASRLRGMAFSASGNGDHGSARNLRYRASLLEARLVDPFWRETAAELLSLPQAA